MRQRLEQKASSLLRHSGVRASASPQSISPLASSSEMVPGSRPLAFPRNDAEEIAAITNNVTADANRFTDQTIFETNPPVRCLVIGFLFCNRLFICKARAQPHCLLLF